MAHSAWAETRALPAAAGQWRDLFRNDAVMLSAGQSLEVPAHGWRVLVAVGPAGG